MVGQSVKILISSNSNPNPILLYFLKRATASYLKEQTTLVRSQHSPPSDMGTMSGEKELAPPMLQSNQINHQPSQAKTYKLIKKITKILLYKKNI